MLEHESQQSAYRHGHRGVPSRPAAHVAGRDAQEPRNARLRGSQAGKRRAELRWRHGLLFQSLDSNAGYLSHNLFAVLIAAKIARIFGAGGDPLKSGSLLLRDAAMRVIGHFRSLPLSPRRGRNVVFHGQEYRGRNGLGQYVLLSRNVTGQ